VTIENKKGIDQQYLQNKQRKQSERNFRKVREKEFDPVTVRLKTSVHMNKEWGDWKSTWKLRLLPYR